MEKATKREPEVRGGTKKLTLFVGGGGEMQANGKTKLKKGEEKNKGVKEASLVVRERVGRRERRDQGKVTWKLKGSGGFKEKTFWFTAWLKKKGSLRGPQA